MVITTDNKKFKIELVMTKLEIGKMLFVINIAKKCNNCDDFIMFFRHE